ncbi:hypothetical protein ACFWHQ_23100 [Streptomyces sp. NPDC060334]|uniref:hypothetical protein n=1 Tax=unclassified Streptomyces TaxID=2593676 RepID=UPI003316ADDB
MAEIFHTFNLALALVDAGDPARAARLLHHRTTHRHHHAYETLLLTRHPAGVPWPRTPSA